MPLFVGTRRILRPVPTTTTAGTSSILTFLGSDFSTANASSYTFSSKDFGTESANRRIIVAAYAYDDLIVSDITTFNSISIGGTNGTLIDSWNTSDSVQGFAVRNVTTGTSGDIVVTLNATAFGCHIAWYSAYISSSTEYFADHIGANGTSASDIFFDWMPSTGFALAIVSHQDMSDRALSLDNDFVEDVEIFSESNSAFYSKLSTGAQSGELITATAPSGADKLSLSIASWTA